MKTEKKRIWRIGDLVLIGGVLAMAVGLFLWLFFGAAKGQRVEVMVDGRTVYSLPLDVDARQIIAGVNGQNTLVIAGGKAMVTTATCPDGVCVRHRPISRAGESILCLPHKVAVTVVGGQPAVDAEVG